MVQIINYDPANTAASAISKPKKRFVIHPLKFLKSKKFWAISGVTLLVLAVLSYFFLFLPIKAIADSVSAAKIEGQIISKDAQDQDVVKLKQDLPILDDKITTLEKKISYFGFVASIPWMGGYYNDSQHLLKSAHYSIDGGKVLVEGLQPFADVLNTKGSSSVTAQQKIQTILPIMPSLAQFTDQTVSSLNLAQKELESVDPNRYPEKIGNTDVRSTLSSYKSLIVDISEFMPQAKNVLINLPTALGSTSPKTYLVLFQNDKELRPTGGFLTAYTYLTIDKGNITTTKSENITTIDDNMRKTFPAPNSILKYLPLVFTWHPRDANLSPDFVTSMNQFESMAAYSSAYHKTDGIIGVDTYFLSDLLKLTGPVSVVGDTFSSDNVVEKLELYAEQVFKNSNNRKGFLGEMMKQVMTKLQTSGKDKWQPLIQTILKSGNEKHFLLYSHDSNVQTVIEKYNWGGRVMDFAGDYLHINDTNFAGAKANLYVKEKITQDITISNSGEVTKKVTVAVTNPAKSDGWLNGPYRDWVRMYVPQGSTYLSSGGGEVKTSVTSIELGKTMFESFFVARPLGAGYSTNVATWSVNYKLPNILTGKTYKMLVQKQPGVDGPEMIININGKKIIDEQLRADKQYDLSF